MNGRHALLVGFTVGRIHANPRMKGLSARIDHGRDRQTRRQDDGELLLQGDAIKLDERMPKGGHPFVLRGRLIVKAWADRVLPHVDSRILVPA